MEDERNDPIVVLMHGDREVSTKQLARQLERKTIRPCEPAVAQRHSGYFVGGTSPFGLRKPMPIYMESTIAGLPPVFINGGKRGFLIGMSADDLVEGLHPVFVDAATS